MDSQEKALTQDHVNEEQTPVQAAAPVEKPQEAQADAKDGEELLQPESTTTEAPVDKKSDHKTYSSKKEVLERIREIAHNEENPDKEEVEHLKSAFYRLHIAEREEQQKAYIEGGGDPEKYQVRPDDEEEAFKAEMQIIKEKRAKAFRKQEEERAENLKRREEIIEKIKNMATSPEEANKSFNAFKQLQQEWKETGAVPPEKANETWKTYQLYVEQFYDLLNLNREAREYDFKKNLEQKTHLCEEAEKLAEETDVVSAFHQLQKLHEQFREIGPVAKDLRDEIWARFKNASTVINKKHQQHFEELRAREEENLKKKTELCEKAENIVKEDIKNSADWEKFSKEIIAIQQEWKTIGFAPQKMNVKIFERFREACDNFFNRKTEYYKELKKRLAENAEKKRVLVEKAQALADSTDWKATSDKLVALQKEWRTIGSVPRKLGDRLWEDFLSACNHFFEARNEANAGSRNEEHANLDKKRDIIAQLKALIDEAGDDAQAKVQALMEQYNAVGHVPYKEKDKLYKEYHEVLDKVYNTLHIKQTRRRLDNFKNNLKTVAKRGDAAVDSERTRLMRRYEQLKQEVTTFETNLGFLNIASKKGNSLVEEMNRKVQKLKDEVQLTFDKIKAIDQQAREEAGNDDKNTEK